MSKLIEAMAEASKSWKSAAPMLNGYRICGVVREGDATHFPWKVFKTADEAHAAMARLNMIAVLRALKEHGPSEGMWGGLARDIMMWLSWGDGRPTPRSLFKHLDSIGREIPQWLRDEPEMQALDHVPSKGTRCVLIFTAMLTALIEESGNAD